MGNEETLVLTDSWTWLLTHSFTQSQTFVFVGLTPLCDPAKMKERSMLLKFLLLWGKQLNLSWTMSCWYVTGVCLLAHSEIRSRGREQRRAVALPVLWEQTPPIGCMSKCPCWFLPGKLREGSWVCAVLHKQSLWKVPPSAWSWSSPCLDHMHGRGVGGGIRGSPAGAHSL